MSISARKVTPLLKVYDMRRSVAFYCDVLGFEIQQKWGPDGHLHWAMLKLGDAVLMLNSRYEGDQQPPEPDARLALGHADTELYFDCPDVDHAYAQLAAKLGSKIDKPRITHYRMKQLTLADPDGFVLCFQQPSEIPML
jgi:catechol 2,3-dioxygenase-like lactoylglutathione lyase family enzyme